MCASLKPIHCIQTLSKNISISRSGANTHKSPPEAVVVEGDVMVSKTGLAGSNFAPVTPIFTLDLPSFIYYISSLYPVSW